MDQQKLLKFLETAKSCMENAECDGALAALSGALDGCPDKGLILPTGIK